MKILAGLLILVSCYAFAGMTVSAPPPTITSLGGIAGSTGGTDNRFLRADGTGGLTLQSSQCGATDGGRLTCVTDGTGTTEFDAITLDLTTGGRPRLNFGAADTALIRIDGTNMVLFDRTNLKTYFTNSLVAGNNLTITSTTVEYAGAGKLRGQGPGAGNYSWAVQDDSGSNDYLGMFRVLINKLSNPGLVIQAAASQTANLLEVKNSSATVLSSVNAVGILVSPKFADTSLPTCDSAVEGGLIYNDTDNVHCTCNGTAWKRMDGLLACDTGL